MLQYFRTWLCTTVKSEEGQDLAEYALLIALIAIVVVVAITALGGTIGGAFNDISEKIGLRP